MWIQWMWNIKMHSILSLAKTRAHKMTGYSLLTIRIVASGSNTKIYASLTIYKESFSRISKAFLKWSETSLTQVNEVKTNLTFNEKASETKVQNNQRKRSISSSISEQSDSNLLHFGHPWTRKMNTRYFTRIYPPPSPSPLPPPPVSNGPLD